jgi:hypothetical protein
MDDELENAMRADPLLQKIGERDLSLAQASLLMGQILGAQHMLRQAKTNGLEFPELDSWLVKFQEYNDQLVAFINKRITSLHGDIP